MTHHIGLDIGGTSAKAVVLCSDGSVIARKTTPLDAGQSNWPDSVRDALQTLIAEHGEAASVGVAGPGIARPDGRAIWWMQGRLADIQELNWTTFLGRSLAVPVLNDAQAALLAEAWLGAAAGEKNAVLLTLGTGVGGAAMVDGCLLRGAVGRAGHLGHISLNPDGPPDITQCPGSLEEAVGNCSVQARTAGRFDSVLKLAAAAAGGDTEAAACWRRSVRALAAGIASLVNVLDPAVVVVGGGIAAAGHSLFQPLEEELATMEWRPHGHRVRVVPAALGEYAGAIGAARNGMIDTN